MKADVRAQLEALATRRREAVELLGAGAHNDFELLAVMAALSGWITRGRAAEMIGVDLAHYRREVEPYFVVVIQKEWPEKWAQVQARGEAI
ncbi:hypothetical protein [Deinococcus marmoris]|uniref:Uncharacterized protein n=1 Tax=Deinococcus marmoris TaxID=249408 RepID=A0A1U7P4Q3_9DEIO|nr:hypothetical protein [Deinococcus marmoris]OLV20138.1 hypothetical protein BOO71_0000442 [Deinococcus marmoris]